MYVVKSTVSLGKNPPIICLDDERNVSEDEILVITIQDSSDCEKQPSSTKTTTISKNQFGETTANLHSNISKELPAIIPERVDHALDTLRQLDMQRSTCKDTPFTGRGFEGPQFCKKVQNVGQCAISGQMPKNMVRQPSNDAKLNFKPSTTTNAPLHPLDMQCSVDSTSKTKLVARRGIQKQPTCDKLPDVKKDAINSKMQANTVRQPLKDAKDNSKPATITHAPRYPIRNRTAKLLPVESFNGVSLPALGHCSKINSCSLQSKLVNELAFFLKNQNDRDCGEENSKNSASNKKKTRKKGKKRKADSAAVVGDDMAHPSKTIKLIPDLSTKAPPSNAEKSVHTNCDKEKSVAIPSIKPIVKSKAKTKRKSRQKRKEICKTNKGNPFSVDEAHICSPTIRLQNLPAEDSVIVIRPDDSVIVIGADSSPDTTLRTELSKEQKNAPLGSCVNPIVLDMSFAHENEEKLQASREKPCSKNQKEVKVDNPEIQILDDMSIHTNSSKVSPSKKNSTIEHITQEKPQAKPLHQTAPNLHGAPANGHLEMTNFLFRSQPAGPFFVPSNSLVHPTFDSQYSAFGIRRTIINDFRLNNLQTNSMFFAGSNLQFNAANRFNAPLALNPAVNEGNVWTGRPFLDPSTDAAPWRHLLAEQAELYRRASRSAASKECSTSNKLRPIAIDGSNIAFSHGKDKVFSTKGIQISIDYFLKRGHVVKAFVPQFRRKGGYNVQDQPLLEKLGKSQQVVFTPSRDINGVNVACYDDRFVLEYASRTGAVILSNDNYRDLMKENSSWKNIINTRLLMYTFADDHFMVPEDPLGRHGPRLDQFLRF